VIDTAVVTGRRSVRRHQGADEVVSGIQSKTLSSIGRRGKYLILRLDGDGVLVVHLGMSGQLRIAPGGDQVAPHTHAILGFSGGSELRFVDPRTFGEMFVTTAGKGGVPAELAHLGPDALTELPSTKRFAACLAVRRTRLKALLLDQCFVAGIGNIYSDEILFRSRLRHDRVACELSDPDARRLRAAISRTLREAVAQRGSTLADLQYRDLRGGMGGFQLRHSVYGREGQSCRRCGSTIIRDKAAGRSTFFCPSCQI
jgi:formamidopyrimidine-DNA glycosylase